MPIKGVGGILYNKCSKCGKQIEESADTKLIPDNQGGITTLCVGCYNAMFPK